MRTSRGIPEKTGIRSKSHSESMAKGIPKSGVNKGWFKKGRPSPRKGKKYPEKSGANHPLWKGGPKKCWCGKIISFYAKNCAAHVEFSPERIKQIRKGAKKRSGSNHHAWKGENVSYRGIHAWIVKNYGQPDTCEGCGIKNNGHKMHWANLSGKYLRSRKDWKRLCPKCHAALDNKNKHALPK